MAYIGRSPQFGAFQTQTITPDGVTTTFTLSYGVSSASSMIVSVGGVVQEPDNAYTLASGGNQIVFSEAPSSLSTVFITFLGQKYDVATVADGSITTAKLATTGVSASTYGGSSQIPVITIGTDGRISAAANTSITLGTMATQNSNSVAITGGTIIGLSNLAGGNATFIANVVAPTFVGNVTASGNVSAARFIGDGSSLTGVASAGFLFNTAITQAASSAITTSMANVFAAPSTAGFEYIIHSLHITNIDGTTAAEVSGQIIGATYPTISFSHLVPVPAGSAVELLKKPKVLQPNDYIQLSANANSRLHATATIERVASTAFFGTGIDLTTATTYTDLHTATANSVIESVLLSNDDGVNDVKARVVWTDGSNNIQGYFAYDLIVPADATIEVLEQPKFLENGYKVRVYTNVANRLEAIIAGKTV